MLLKTDMFTAGIVAARVIVTAGILSAREIFTAGIFALTFKGAAIV